MQTIRTSSYGWAVGGLSVLLGALMLISPHQFQFLNYTSQHPYNWITGGVLTLAGLGLISAWALSLARVPVTLIHLIAGSVLLVLAADSLASRSPIEALNYALIGGSTILAGVIRGVYPGDDEPDGPDLLILSLGFSGIAGGAALAFSPAENQFLGLAAGSRAGVGAAFLLAGAWVTAIQLARGRKPVSGPRGDILQGRWVYAAHGLFGVLFGLLLWLSSRNGFFSYEMAVQVLFGLLLAAWPLLSRFPAPIRRKSARAGVALALVVAAIIPLILTVTIISEIHEAALHEQFLLQQENRAVALAHDITDYLSLYRAAVAELAGRPGFAALPIADQQATLDGFITAYPDTAFYALVAPEGTLHLAGGGHVPPGPTLAELADLIPAEGAASSSALTPLYGTDTVRFVFIAPFAGSRLVIGLQSEHTKAFLNEQSRITGTQALLVDHQGRLVLAPAGSRLSFQQDLSTYLQLGEPDRLNPVVSANLQTENGGALVSSAEVPGLGWRVVIESQAEATLAGIQRGRDAAYLILVGALTAATFGGLFLAGWLTEPLRALIFASGQLASGNVHVPLPHSKVLEIDQLMRAFENMRQSLDRRTYERDLAEEALRNANLDLETRVRERTAALEQANLSLRAEIVQRERAETRLAGYTQQLERSNQELQDFAYIASHDLQEPLRKIQAFGQRVLDLYLERLDERGQDYLQRMVQSAARMQAMINDLLTYSRVTTHAKPLQNVDLTQILHQVASDLELSIHASGARVEIGDLPTVQADPVQMHQLFQNLLSNALKFHREDAPPVIRVYNEPCPSSGSNGSETDTAHPPCVRIVVEDNGIGFDVRYLDRIFQPFQRLHGKSTYPGSGIGLAICRKIVERHEGSLSAESTPGKGARFIVTLPTRPAPALTEEE